ncbi:NCS1 family nucleobase:cation symporter-1 [Hoeflea sp. CAU 1731]
MSARSEMISRPTGYDKGLWNPDFAPTRPDDRTWTWPSFSWLWVGLVVNIAAYVTASSLMAQGLTWWQAMLAVLVGNSILVAPLVLIGRMGVLYRVPFPVLLRSSFGTIGARLPAMLRAVVACGWFGIQTWIGGSAIYAIAKILFPSVVNPFSTTIIPVIGLDPIAFGSFIAFWGLHVFFIAKGVESIRWLETIAGPLLLTGGLAALAWVYVSFGSFGKILETSQQLIKPGEHAFWMIFGTAVTAVVGGWATLALNIPDFTRFARSGRDQVIGQALGLPLPAMLLAFIGVVVTSASYLALGKVIWNPVTLAGELESWLTVVLLFFLIVATITTNIAANVVSPSNDFSNLAPGRISFKMGGYITVVIGVLMFPWKLMESANAYIFVWLIAYGALLGPIAGVMIADFYLVRRGRIAADDLFLKDGCYRYWNGWNLSGVAALVIGVTPCFPGFLHAVGLWPDCPDYLQTIYDYSWFVGFIVAFVVYPVLMGVSAPERRDAVAP